MMFRWPNNHRIEAANGGGNILKLFILFVLSPQHFKLFTSTFSTHLEVLPPQERQQGQCGKTDRVNFTSDEFCGGMKEEVECRQFDDIKENSSSEKSGKAAEKHFPSGKSTFNEIKRDSLRIWTRIPMEYHWKGFLQVFFS